VEGISSITLVFFYQDRHRTEHAQYGQPYFEPPVVGNALTPDALPDV
jgi:hypothetical protein